MPSYNREIALPGKSSKDIFEKIAADIDRFVQKYPLGKYEIERDAASSTVRLKSSLVSLNLVCEEGKVRIDGNLSLMAMAIKGKIDEGIDKWLAKTFPPA